MKITKILLTTALLALPLTVQADALSVWTQYADSHGLPYTPSFDNTAWVEGRLTAPLPDEPYPNPTPDNLKLYINDVRSVDSLSSVTHVKTDLLLFRSNLANVDGLKNLEYVGDVLALFVNRLGNVDGLSKLKHVRQLELSSNPYLTDLNGLASIQHAEEVFIDRRINNRWDFVPIPADAWLCQPSQVGVFKQASQDEACDQNSSNT